MAAIEGNLELRASASLASVAGLASIGPGSIVGDVYLNPGPPLSDLGNLGVLESIGGDMTIAGSSLTDLSGLSGLTCLGGSLNVIRNPDLTSLVGLEGLVSVGGYGGSFTFFDNGLLCRSLVDDLAAQVTTSCDCSGNDEGG